ncbi:type II toxin-antitoxin system RelE/ParE family toxin [Granulicella sp. 5B5]|uniref:type II toxin-antitoxin system RelE/ParE family toxin n=1 Tax=Granulicella sp. 5B5 TaxID=1617967 RepID=UPI0015F5CFD5|nr:type II toxin-antitoxin system RelE/ParE family toxin [Granulicella sp. 5B5]
MAYEVRLAKRAIRDLSHIYETINAESSQAAALWFRGLEAAIFSLETHPERCAMTPERSNVRHLLYGNKPHIYRVLFTVDEERRVVSVAQIRHGARHPIHP